MENWEERFNRMQTPDASVPSHREGLKKKLQSDRIPAGQGRRTVTTLTVAVLVLFSGLTIVYPGWTKDLWKTIFIQTITLHVNDGQTISIKKFLEESPVPCDSSDPMTIFESGEQRTIILEAGIENVDITGESGETITISTADANAVWVVNGDTVDSKDVSIEMGDLRETSTDPGEESARAKEMTAEMDEAPEVSAGFELHQNYPNPFNPETQISFDLPQSSPVSLRVFNLTGQEVATLVDGYLNAGPHSVTFNGGGLPSGTYLYTLQVEGKQITKKMILAK